MKPLLSAEDLVGLNSDRSDHAYLPDQGLIDAYNVAVILGRPLLLTGEPGTGKTSFAGYIASKFNLGEELRFQTKSTSIARDLFYYYDSLGHFHAAQIRNEGENKTSSLDAALYIKFRALGEAFIRTNRPSEVVKKFPKIKEMLPGFKDDAQPSQSVVLIDEIDKAPRDFANDLLHEIYYGQFDIPELNGISFTASKDPNLRPIVIITSNSERNLPDAFLRRCVYYDIPFPSDERMKDIAAAHRKDLITRGNAQLGAAIELFYYFRASAISKRPSTAELLDWLQAIAELNNVSFKGDSLWSLDEEKLQSASPVIIKKKEDLQAAKDIITKWLLNRAKTMSAMPAKN
jgi:MoxR-like ATPase